MAGAVAAGLLLANRRIGVVAAVAALLMAFSRVYIGAHYPWDVLGGLLLGAFVVLDGWFLLRGPLTGLTRWLRALPGLRVVFADLTDEPGPSTRSEVSVRRPELAARP